MPLAPGENLPERPLRKYGGTNEQAGTRPIDHVEQIRSRLHEFCFVALDHALEASVQIGLAAFPPSPDSEAGSHQTEKSLRAEELGISGLQLDQPIRKSCNGRHCGGNSPKNNNPDAINPLSTD